MRIFWLPIQWLDCTKNNVGQDLPLHPHIVMFIAIYQLMLFYLSFYILFVAMFWVRFDAEKMLRYNFSDTCLSDQNSKFLSERLFCMGFFLGGGVNFLGLFSLVYICYVIRVIYTFKFWEQNDTNYDFKRLYRSVLYISTIYKKTFKFLT